MEDTHTQWLPTHIIHSQPPKPTVVDKFAAPKIHDEDKELFTNSIVNLKKTQDLWGEAIGKHLPPPPCGGKHSMGYSFRSATGSMLM